MAAIDPQELAKKALLRDKKVVADFGRVVVESGAYLLPQDVLVGALLDAVKKYTHQDKQATEAWRELGGRFLGEKNESRAARPAGKTADGDTAAPRPKAANAD